MVHSVRALLAARATCTDPLPGCLAVVSSVAADRNHDGGRVCLGLDSALSAGSPARMAEASVFCVVKMSPKDLHVLDAAMTLRLQFELHWCRANDARHQAFYSHDNKTSNFYDELRDRLSPLC